MQTDQNANAMWDIFLIIRFAQFALETLSQILMELNANVMLDYFLLIRFVLEINLIHLKYFKSMIQLQLKNF
jgi:hypothetical protein